MANALTLLGAYDSEDEEIEEDVQEEILEKNYLEKVLPKKRSLEDDTPKKEMIKKANIYIKTRLPAPNIVLANAAPNIDHHTDNPELHDGRIRLFAHERGNWVTFIYIKYDNEHSLDQLAECLSDLHEDLKIVDDFHISLTKTFVLRHHLIESFIDTVRTNVSTLSKFSILLRSLKIYCNEDKSRTFVSVKVKSGVSELKDLVHSLDKSLLEFKLPTFYEDPSFHMSILWCTGDKYSELNNLLPKMKELFSKFSYKIDECEPFSIAIPVEELVCKTGNKLYKLRLKAQ